jgi:hypothetical protein
MAFNALPNIDPDIKFVGVSKLRDLNATKLREQRNDTFVIQENDTPLSVLLSYKRYLEMRDEFNAMLSTIECLTSQDEREGITRAFEDLRMGRVKSLAEIDAELKAEK